MTSNKVVSISIDDDSSCILKKLNLSSKLSGIREELENLDINNKILLFSHKVDDEFYELEREQEENFLLEEILTVDNGLNILYLKKRFHWKILNDKCKLDYARTMSFDGINKAKKKAFIMKDCEMKLIGIEGYKKGQLYFKSKEDWMMKTNLFFSTDMDVNSVGLKILIEKLKDKNLNDEIKSTYQYTEFSKVSLKLSKENLELTDDFKNDVIDAIKSKNPREEFKKIIQEYGQIIPTEFILGGRVYSKDEDISSTSKFYNFDRIRLLGGKSLPDFENFDEKVWIESLEDYQNWDCIEFRNPISIFQLLPDELRKQAFKSIGRRILYRNTEVCDYEVNKLRKPMIYELDNLSQNIIPNKDADCDIFATVVDTEDSRNTFFNCQILRRSNGKASIIIHCVQKKFRGRKYKLKIGLMVTGYDIGFDLILSDISVELVKKNYDSQNRCEFFSIPLERCELDLRVARGNPFFGIPILSDLDPSNNSIIIGHNFRNTQIDTFSYCLEKKCFVNLPKFTFCIFIIILNNPAHYASLPLKFKMFGNPFIDLEILQSNSNAHNPKYVSLYLSNNDNYKPIFLKQKIREVKLIYVDCKCKGKCSICKDKPKQISKNDNNSCILFDP